MSTETFRTIIGSNHGKARARIWIEGARLIRANFIVGTRYERTHDSGVGFILTVNPQGRYRVSGKGVNPIIDITGAKVAELFPEPLTHVLVRFSPDLITVTEK